MNPKPQWSLWAAAFCALLLASCQNASPPSEVVVIRGETMGTYYQVSLAPRADGAPINADATRAAIDGLLEQVNDEMSTYRPESELSRFNRAAADRWFPVSADTARVTAAALELGVRTDGIFDVSAGPLINLWSFGPGGGLKELPSEQALAEARAKVDYRRLEARLDPPALRKSLGEMYIDLSGIAKGDAVDRLAELLLEWGYPSFLADIGGENVARGIKPNGTPWRIAIEIPSESEAGIQRALPLRDRAIATSGDYRNFFMLDGERYSHIVDPRTGRPGRHTLASVSVLAESCQEADGLATALMVMGAEEALKFAEQGQLAVLLVERTDEGFVERVTSRFSEWTK